MEKRRLRCKCRNILSVILAVTVLLTALPVSASNVNADDAGSGQELEVTTGAQEEDYSTIGEDDPYGYLMVHFLTPDSARKEYRERVYLSISQGDDPARWDTLNNGEAILANHEGTTGVRDPYIAHNPETGKYYIITTDLRAIGGDGRGYPEQKGSTYINVWESEDLIHWGEVRQIDVALGADGTKKAHLGMMWAPEATWVPDYYGEGDGAFVVYWNSQEWLDEDQTVKASERKREFWGVTKDFTQDTWEFGGHFVGDGTESWIDSAIAHQDGTTYHVTKTTKYNPTKKSVTMQSTTSKTWWDQKSTQWTTVQENVGSDLWDGENEGPALFKDNNDENTWYLFLDNLSRGGYKLLKSTDLSQGFQSVPASEFSLRKETKHGGVVSLTKRQYDAIRSADAVSAVKEDLGSIEVETGSSADAVAKTLPQYAEVNLANGYGTSELPVIWDTSAINLEQEGTYEVTGIVQSLQANTDSWQSESGVNVYADGDSRVPISTKAIKVKATVKVTSDTKPYGYLMVHFVEDADGYAEKIYLDISRGDNPQQWDPLNGREPILASNLGTTGVRDPYITYNPETETYYIIATDLRVQGGDKIDGGSWDSWVRNYSTKMNVWESKDLINWSDVRQFDVACDKNGIEQQTQLGMMWAPEATWVPDYYEEGKGAFVVYWTSTVYPEGDEDHTNEQAKNNGKILWGVTTDFTQETFEFGGIMLDRNYPILDTTILQDGDTTYHVTKRSSTQKYGAFMEYTSDKEWWREETNWTLVQEEIGNDKFPKSEGPAVFKDHSAKNRWYLLLDAFSTSVQLGYEGYQPMLSENLKGNWQHVDQSDFVLTPKTKHGGVISLTKERYNAIRNADAVSAVSENQGNIVVSENQPVEELEAMLPQTAAVNLAYEMGTSELPVSWDISNVDMSKPKSYQIKGKIRTIGANNNEWVGKDGSTRYNAEDRKLYSTTVLEVTATVTVREIIGVENVSASTVKGHQPTLPEEVTVYYKNGDSASQKVVWDLDGLTFDTVGIVTVTGKAGVNTVTASVRVADKPAENNNTPVGKNLALNKNGSSNPQSWPRTLAYYSNAGDLVHHTTDGAKEFVSGAGKKIWSDYQKDQYHTNPNAAVGAVDHLPFVASAFGTEGSTSNNAQKKYTVNQVSLGFMEVDGEDEHKVRLPKDYKIEYYSANNGVIPASRLSNSSAENIGNTMTWGADNPIKAHSGWTEVSYRGGKPAVPDVENFKHMVDIRFDSVETTAIRVTITPQDENWTGLEEFEVYYFEEVEPFEDYEVTEILIGGVNVLNQFDEESKTLTLADSVKDITATATNNASISILKAVDGRAKIIFLPENGDSAKRQEYNVCFTADPQYLEGVVKEAQKAQQEAEAAQKAAEEAQQAAQAAKIEAETEKAAAEQARKDAEEAKKAAEAAQKAAEEASQKAGEDSEAAKKAAEDAKKAEQAAKEAQKAAEAAQAKAEQSQKDAEQILEDAKNERLKAEVAQKAAEAAQKAAEAAQLAAEAAWKKAEAERLAAEAERLATEEAAKKAAADRAAAEQALKNAEAARKAAQDAQLAAEKAQKAAEEALNKSQTTEKITVKKAKLESVKSSKKSQIKVKWSKIKGILGYELQYTYGNFKNAKVKNVSSIKTTLTLKKLKSKKVYKVRIRAYKVVNGKKTYGKFSAIKKVRVK